MIKYIVIILVFALGACVEPFEFETETFENVLVIEASLTNENKRHQVVLSRAFRFEEEESVPERNANIVISDELQNDYVFQETSPGVYLSSTAFAAQRGVKYSLNVTTTDGASYSSMPEAFESEATITEVYAERELNASNEESMSIYIDANSSSDNAPYYRYEYEETYKIIAPYWNPVEFKFSNYDPCGLPTITYDLSIEQREQEERVCFNTLKSQDIIQNSVADLTSNTTERFLVRSIKADDFILSHRYSILVKQFTQSIDAFSYYQNVGNFSSSESVFSEVQPGFLEGNITSTNGTDKVLGYFEVASVSEKRLFFNYRDFYPDAPLPLFITNCAEIAPPLEHVSFCFTGPVGPNPCPQSLVQRLDLDLVSYVGSNGGDIGVCPGPYVVVQKECGDCTELGSNIVPDFWVDE